MGEPYPVEAGACSYTHTRLANCPYEARLQQSFSLTPKTVRSEEDQRQITWYVS